MDEQSESLRLFPGYSVLSFATLPKLVFAEGPPSDAAKKRLELIKRRLREGYLTDVYNACKHQSSESFALDHIYSECLTQIVNSVTSEQGRALVGLTLLQLAIKSIEPCQSVRLHKAGPRGFSWVEGVPMRNIDREFITPFLREANLLRLNKDGFMMTRSLAENYPYCQLYKASIRGAKDDWIRIVDGLEMQMFDSETALHYMIARLRESQISLEQIQHELMIDLDSLLSANPDYLSCYSILKAQLDESSHAPRLFEIALHSFFQALFELTKQSGFLRPLGQMRSANKKHGNIGDVEILKSKDEMDIIESWDAKYGKLELAKELKELDDKLNGRQCATTVGFVTLDKPIFSEEVKATIDQIRANRGIHVQILCLDEWATKKLALTRVDRDKVGIAWIRAFCETLCQRRREQAAIDEPSRDWVSTMHRIVKRYQV